MPAIPTYGGETKVAQAPLPGVGVRGDAPSAAFGVPHEAVDLGGVANVAGAMASEARQKADAMAVDAGELAHATLQTNLMTKAVSAQGTDALGAASDAQQEYRTQSQAIIDGLPNDRVKQLVAHRAVGYYASLYAATESHAAAETKKADSASVASLLANDLQTVSQMPSMAAGAVEKAKARTADFGRRNGWTPEQIDQESTQRVSSIHFAALGKLLQDGDPRDVALASGYFDANKDALVGKQRLQAESMVDEANAQSQGYKESDRILGLNQPPVGGDDPDTVAVQQGVTTTNKAPPTMSQALAEAEQIQDPKARKAATTEIVAHFTHQETAARYDREAASADVMQYVESHGGRIPYASAAWQAIAGHPEGEHAQHRSDQLLKPTKDPGDPDAYLSRVILSASSAQGHETFMQETPKDWRDAGMNTQQITHLVTMQQRATGTDAKSDVQAEAIRMQRESALLKATNAYGGVGANISPASKLKLDAEIGRIKFHYDNLATAHGIGASSGDAAPAGSVRMGSSQPQQPVDHSAPLLSAMPAIQPTAQMLQEAALHPEYAAALRKMNVALPKHLPVPELRK